jgi:peptidoglycan LD-endopeptidase LytH
MRTFRWAVFWLGTVLYFAALSRDAWERSTSPVAASFRFAKLLAEPPDASISMPVAGVRVRRVANTWQAARVGHQHQGQDIFAKRDTPVFSATEGIVVRVGDAGIGGNSVSVLGAGGRIYYYAHLARFADAIQLGQPVTRDSVLGYVGNTGNARTTPPHLHFGIYSAQGAINPLPLLVDRQPTPESTSPSAGNENPSSRHVHNPGLGGTPRATPQRVAG